MGGTPVKPKKHNEDQGKAGRPQRACPQAHIHRVESLAKDDGHLLRYSPCDCTLEGALKHFGLNQRFLNYFIIHLRNENER